MSHFVAHLLHAYGYPVIVLTIGLECAGLLVPGEALLVGASLLAAHGHLSIVLVVLSAATGAILGNLLGYAIGWKLGRTILTRHGGRIGLTAPRMTLGHYLFAKHGGKVVFFSRFVAVLRSFAPLLAGAGQMEWRQFLLFSVAGGIAWPAIHGGAVYSLDSAAERLSGPASLVLAIAAVLAIMVAVRIVRRNESRLTQAALRWEHHEKV